MPGTNTKGNGAGNGKDFAARWRMARESAARQAAVEAEGGLAQKMLRAMGRFNGSGSEGEMTSALMQTVQEEFAAKGLKRRISDKVAAAFVASLLSGDDARLGRLERVQADKALYKTSIREMSLIFGAAERIGKAIASGSNAIVRWRGMDFDTLHLDEELLSKRIHQAGTLDGAAASIASDINLPLDQKERVLAALSKEHTRKILLNGTALAVHIAVEEVFDGLSGAFNLQQDRDLALSLQPKITGMYGTLGLDIFEDRKRGEILRDAAEVSRMLSENRRLGDAMMRLMVLRQDRELLRYHLDVECPELEQLVAQYVMAKAVVDGLLMDRQLYHAQLREALGEFVAAIESMKGRTVVDMGGLETEGPLPTGMPLITIRFTTVGDEVIDQLKDLVSMHQVVLDLACGERAEDGSEKEA